MRDEPGRGAADGADAREPGRGWGLPRRPRWRTRRALSGPGAPWAAACRDAGDTDRGSPAGRDAPRARFARPRGSQVTVGRRAGEGGENPPGPPICGGCLRRRAPRAQRGPAAAGERERRGGAGSDALANPSRAPSRVRSRRGRREPCGMRPRVSVSGDSRPCRSLPVAAVLLGGRACKYREPPWSNGCCVRACSMRRCSTREGIVAADDSPARIPAGGGMALSLS